MDRKLFNFKNAAMVAVFSFVTLIGFNSFEKPKKSEDAVKLTTYKWFQIIGNHSPTAQIPSADAIYLSSGTTPPPEADDCGGGTLLCVAGFTPNQVNGSNQLKDDLQTAPQNTYRKTP